MTDEDGESPTLPAEGRCEEKTTAAAPEDGVKVDYVDCLTLWRQGKGPFPVEEARSCYEHELIRALNELKEDDPSRWAFPEYIQEIESEVGRMNWAIDWVLGAIERGHPPPYGRPFIGAVPAIREKFLEWKEPFGKLIFASYLTALGDFTAVEYARNIWDTASDQRLRKKAYRTLKKVWSDDELAAMATKYADDEEFGRRLQRTIQSRKDTIRLYYDGIKRLGPLEAKTDAELWMLFYDFTLDVPSYFFLPELYRRHVANREKREK